MRIGELATRTGVNARLLRYYQEQDLLHPSRTPNGYRDFDEGAVERVRRIRALLEAGLSTSSIRRMLPCFSRSGGALRARATPAMEENLVRELRAIEERVAVLTSQADIIRAFLQQARQSDRQGPDQVAA